MSASDALDRIRNAKAAGKRIAALTAYDYPTARLLDESGLDILLVGDSLGMVVLGYPDTTHVTMAEMIHHTRPVARAVRHALVLTDLPIHSYRTPAEAVENARMLMDAGAQGVKLEGGTEICTQIAALVAEGIPVMGHIGMLPQHVLEEGGYKIKGRSMAQAAQLVRDAHALEAAGCFSMVLELVEAEVATRISRELGIPTIGIGSGPGCDGEILVSHDLIGLFPWFRPKFAKPHAEISADIQRAAALFVEETQQARMALR